MLGVTQAFGYCWTFLAFRGSPSYTSDFIPKLLFDTAPETKKVQKMQHPVVIG
jgi:hypothetical protein